MIELSAQVRLLVASENLPSAHTEQIELVIVEPDVGPWPMGHTATVWFLHAAELLSGENMPSKHTPQWASVVAEPGMEPWPAGQETIE